MVGVPGRVEATLSLDLFVKYALPLRIQAAQQVADRVRFRGGALVSGGSSSVGSSASPASASVVATSPGVCRGKLGGISPSEAVPIIINDV
jgi:hypothetical protein